MEETDAVEEHRSKLGRHTIEDDWLSCNRDALLNMFVFAWAEVGWQLGAADTRDALRLALEPIKDHTNRQYIDRLLRITNAVGDEHEIRKKRLSLGKAVSEMHSAQSNCSKCMSRCRDIEAAMVHAIGDQCEILVPEFSKRRIECQAAQDKSWAATAAQANLENALVEEEAAYAQNQLLMFILRRKYAFHPFNVANAIAGLPFAIEVPFMGVWQSHARCSKMKSPAWPHYRYDLFKFIESSWKAASSSAQPMVDVFEKRIRDLPRKVTQDHPQMGPRRIENYVRTFLCENWWYLQRAIRRALETTDDPRPQFFVIASNLERFVAEPRTHADVAIADSAKICD